MNIHRLDFGKVRVADNVYPVFAYLVCLAGGQKILIDSGGNIELNQVMTKYKLWTEFHLERDLQIELHKLNLDINDINYLLQTHLHHDHVSCLEFLDFDKQKLIVAKQEVEALPKRRFTIDYNVSYLKEYLPNFTLVDFEEVDLVALSDSITLVKTNNHTRGHMSVAIVEDNQYVFFTGDSFYTDQEMTNYFRDEENKDTPLYKRLKNLLSVNDYSIYFSHCEKVLSYRDLLKGS
jgi:metallo-beta-lactamase superfamily